MIELLKCVSSVKTYFITSKNKQKEVTNSKGYMLCFFRVSNVKTYFITSKNKQKKVICFASSALLRLIFSSNSAVFVGGGAKIFFTPGQKYFLPMWRH